MYPDDSQLLPQITDQGFALVEQLITTTTIERILGAIATLNPSTATRTKAGQTYALRNVLTNVPLICAIAQQPPLINLAQQILGPHAQPVKGTLFNKTPAANWKVPWHQDCAIAVQTQIDAPGFGPWSCKAGVPYCQPPSTILEHMIALRIHLDDCPIHNGPLSVIPGSHRHGKLSPDQIAGYPRKEVICTASAGDVLILRPLILHRSVTAHSPAHRRVLHLEYAAQPLPSPLQWPQLPPPAQASHTIPWENPKISVSPNPQW